MFVRFALLGAALGVGFHASFDTPRSAPATATTDSVAIQTVRLRFAAEVGETPFSCGGSYAKIGVTKARITPTDMRFFVHDVRLVRADGSDVPLSLTQDSLWQFENIALLDFENGGGPCENGTPQTRNVVEGTVPVGDYAGVRFTIGVPFERNHLDLATQPSPLSLTAMFWAWNSGHKFMRVDLQTGLKSFWMVHLGSTGCTPDGSASTIPTQCTFPNRPTIELSDFSLSRDEVVFDLGRLLARANVSVNQPKTAAGCMSGQQDGDCAPLFAALGLPFREQGAHAQTTFRKRPSGATP